MERYESNSDESFFYSFVMNLTAEIYEMLCQEEIDTGIQYPVNLDEVWKDFSRNGKKDAPHSAETDNRRADFSPVSSRPDNKIKEKNILIQCAFCKKNGEDPQRYNGHSLRNEEGKVTCPALRAYNCPICQNNGGDYAHTIKYCPMNNLRQLK